MDVAWGEFAGGRRRHQAMLDENDAFMLCKIGGGVFGGQRDGSGISQLWKSCSIGVQCMTACGDLVTF